MNDITNNTIISILTKTENGDFQIPNTIEHLGGLSKAVWDNETPISSNAHSVVISQMLKTSGIFKRLVESCPLVLTSPNAPSISALIGTAVLGIINGACRYRHFDHVKGDEISADVFGIKRLMSCDSMRRNFKKIPEKDGLEWIWNQTLKILEPLLSQPYILDMDPTVKPLYGHQEGAEIGYNPQKPGRPSHCYHTLCIAEARLVLGVVVMPGNKTSGSHSSSMLNDYLNWICVYNKPKLIRGDVGFGNELIIDCCESHEVPYLFKIRRTSLVNGLFKTHLGGGYNWTTDTDGWECLESEIRLSGWGKSRRLIFARRPLETMKKRKKSPPKRTYQETSLPGIDLVISDDEKFADGYEWYAVVTDLELNGTEIAQLYRQRGNCENIFDEQKNQWGWGGFVTQDLKRTAIFAGLCALISNIWNIFTRIGNNGEHQEAITSRPLLQNCIAKITSHGRQQIITFYSAGKSVAIKMYQKISAVLSTISTATQISSQERWYIILLYAFRKYKFIINYFPPEIREQMMLLF